MTLLVGRDSRLRENLYAVQLERFAPALQRLDAIDGTPR
jgi:hypothetical protein